MLGILINESFEVLYTILNLTVQGSRGVYNWYYGEESSEQKLIKELTQRIEDLEKPKSK